MLEVIKSLRDLDDLMHEWNLLPGAQQNPLLRHEWFLSAAEAFHNKHDLRVITLRESGRLRAVAPLALVKRHGIQRLELLGASALHEPSDVLYDGADSLLELCAVIARLPQATVLQRVMESSLLMDQLMQRSQGHGKLLKLSATPAPFIDIQAPGNAISIRFLRGAVMISVMPGPSLSVPGRSRLSSSSPQRPILSATCKKPFESNRRAGKAALVRR